MHRLHSPSIKSYEFSFKLSIYVARLHENRISASTLALRLYAVYPSESSSYLLLRWISFICTLKVLDVVQSGEWNWWQFYAYMYDYEGLQSKIFSLYSCMCVLYECECDICTTWAFSAFGILQILSCYCNWNDVNIHKGFSYLDRRQ